jgi:hypothetical protein
VRKRARDAERAPSASQPALKRLRLDADRVGTQEAPARPVREGDPRRTLSPPRRLNAPAAIGNPADGRSPSADDELELSIPMALGADRLVSPRGGHHAVLTGWWQRLDDDTRRSVKFRLGADFDFERDDPARSWRNIPSPGHWNSPRILIQWDSE